MMRSMMGACMSDMPKNQLAAIRDRNVLQNIRSRASFPQLKHLSLPASRSERWASKGAS